MLHQVNLYFIIATVVVVDVYLVGDKAGSAEAAGTAHPVHPFRPLGIQPAVRFLILVNKNQMKKIALHYIDRF